MAKETIVAAVDDGWVSVCDQQHCPYYFLKHSDRTGWLARRAIDTDRTHFRMLKNALNIIAEAPWDIAMLVYGDNLTDHFWFKPFDLAFTYGDIRFTDNPADRIALNGGWDIDQPLSLHTLELTNIGSFEKCWKYRDGTWWLYKAENPMELFSELMVSLLDQQLGMDVVHYQIDGSTIRCLNFVDTTTTFDEPISSLMDDNEDYHDGFA